MVFLQNTGRQYGALSTRSSSVMTTSPVSAMFPSPRVLSVRMMWTDRRPCHHTALAKPPTSPLTARYSYCLSLSLASTCTILSLTPSRFYLYRPLTHSLSPVSTSPYLSLPPSHPALPPTPYPPTSHSHPSPSISLQWPVSHPCWLLQRSYTPSVSSFDQESQRSDRNRSVSRSSVPHANQPSEHRDAAARTVQPKKADSKHSRYAAGW